MQRKTLVSTMTIVVLVTAGIVRGEPTIPEGMVLIEGGTFPMGFAAGHADERPVHEVKIDSYVLDRYPVTNCQFAAFVEATGYVTQAEREGHAWGFLKGDMAFRRVEGANWRQPEGEGSGIDDRMDHPVVCVTWHDAAAYAKWAGKRLPTEAEWEYAARAGGGPHLAADPARPVTDPDPDAQAQQVRANVWHGNWPVHREPIAGFNSTIPAGQFEANALGLYDMVGNVWEWTADWYAADYYARSPRANPRGPQTGQHRVARGGSWFCSPAYCSAYNTHFRGASPPDHAFTNVGFRCAKDWPQE